MNARKQAYKDFATMVAGLIKSRENGNWPKSAEAFCVSIESKLDNYNYGYDPKKLSYNTNEPAYELFYEAVARKIENLNLNEKKDIEKKEIYDQTYNDIKELFEIFNLNSLLEEEKQELPNPPKTK